MVTDERLTIKEEIFVLEVVKGSSQADAYRKAYPASKKYKDASVWSMASTLMKKPRVNKRYNELLEEFRAREKEKIGWTREQSIETLRFVIDTNKKEIERIQIAAEEELEFLAKQIQENPQNAINLTIIALNKRKELRAKMTSNTALISAVSELNKMQGYNEQNINMNGTVVFQDEEDLPE